jgi:hypothetical protein
MEGGKRKHGKPRNRWEDNIKMGLEETMCRSVDWLHQVQDRIQWHILVNAVIRCH